MKKLLPVIFIAVFCFSGLKGQNTYDTYTTCNYPAVDFYGNIISVSAPGPYTGEYQIFLKDHPWGVSSGPISSNTISYRIETVSFPFTPNCYNCQPAGGPIDPARILVMPDDILFPYIPVKKAWVRDPLPFGTPPGPPGSNTFDYELRREFYGLYADPTMPDLALLNTHFATLASVGVANVGTSEAHAPRVIYPHTILKHTFYMHCGSNITDPIVDSFSFLIDNTRGLMRKYPFSIDNNTSSTVEHDIAILPTTIAPDPSFPYLNYFPPINLSGACANHQLIRPIPNSLTQFFLGNANAQASAGYINTSALFAAIVEHEYKIDLPINLTIINPSEKIIYNPSEVEIDLNNAGNLGSRTLVFPSGYTFKTVSGIYPTTAQVFAADPNRLYNDPRNIPYSTTLSCDDPLTSIDERKSYYYVKSGSTLYIEPCVSIYDAVIVVENGGILTYDSRQTYGNYVVVSDAGSTINNLVLPVSANCFFDCYNIDKYDVSNIVITSPTTWAPLPMSSMPFDFNGDGKVTISGAITILANQTLTINGPLLYEFGENAQIIVQRGAKLIVNGATFTSAEICKKGMWGGIEVWGDRTVGQGGLAGANSQGAVELTNATIMNARNAISTRNGADTWNYNGGIIRCNNVIFKNNRTSVGFLSYHNKATPTSAEIKNFSFLRNCQFLTTDYLNDPIYRTANGRRLGNVAQVTMWDVKDVTIENCLFENSAVKTDGSPLFDTDIRGAGIYAIDAGIRLSDSPSPNQFKGYSDAIWAISTGRMILSGSQKQSLKIIFML